MVEDYLRHVDLNELRFRWPTEFIFFCGGRSTEHRADPVSLRHYLLAERNIGSRLDAKAVLAEAANQIYRDTTYKDLITYEEDIAKISRVVLLVAESAGSLAELGAFSSTPSLKAKLAVIIQQDYFEAESFVRFGPIRRLENEEASRVAYFPWKVNSRGRVVKASINGHVKDIVAFINRRVARGEKTFSFGAEASRELRDFAIVLWLSQLAQVITLERITEYAEILGNPISRNRAHNFFYCMKLAGWMDNYPYSGSTYVISKFGGDVVSRYAFKTNSPIKDAKRWVALTQAAIVKEASISKALLRSAMDRRNA
ncbi:retron St85 family effector protein [Paracoccus luteus]|uniref:retron St85 family effector protein n=1 Tax=Paracoccus luteus TaxID=2508543 RepID=UPI001FE640E7|nr:retron St85 family effector protein [Paracoccus luteus]